MKCVIITCRRNRRHLKWCGRHYAYQWLHGYPEIPDPSIKLFRISKHNAIWLAAVVDCEGWIGMMRTRRGGGYAYWVRIGVGNTNIRLIRRIKQITHIGRVYLSTRLKPAKDLWQWNVDRNLEVKRLLKTIYPYLILKRRQAILILKSPPKHTKNRTLRMKLWNDLHLLNKKGR